MLMLAVQKPVEKRETCMTKLVKPVALQAGQPVVFVCEVAYKSAAGRTSHVARIGSTGKIRKDNKDGTYVVDVDRKLSNRRNVVDNAKPEWIAAIPEQRKILIEEAARPEDSGPNWKGFTYSQLKSIAETHNLSWRETPNERINVMWVIDALKKAGIEPPTATTTNATGDGQTA
jgi:hypothetical protein